MARITVVTAGHLSTCPRMLKAADAFAEAGHDVRVVSTISTPWAAAADRELQRRRPWRWDPIDYRRDGDARRWLVTGLRAQASQLLARGLNGHAPASVIGHALGRVHTELVREILRAPQDLIYGGTRGALAAVVAAARRSGTPCAVDFEDLHCAEELPVGAGRLRNSLSAAAMRDAAKTAAFLTAGSGAIAEVCHRLFDVQPIAINNVFRLGRAPRVEHQPGPLRLYWFSQTIGPGRGLEDIVDAAGLAGIRCELHLRGVPAAGYVESLRARIAATAPALALEVHPPAPPDRMIDSCEGFDIGISADQGPVTNRELCLTNKALTYPLAGLALVLTDTPGHRPLAVDLFGQAVTYRPGNVMALADGLGAWADPALLRRSREASWEAAQRRWHWDHPLEREALLTAVERVVR